MLFSPFFYLNPSSNMGSRFWRPPRPFLNGIRRACCCRKMALPWCNSGSHPTLSLSSLGFGGGATVLFDARWGPSPVQSPLMWSYCYRRCAVRLPSRLRPRRRILELQGSCPMLPLLLIGDSVAVVVDREGRKAGLSVTRLVVVGVLPFL